MSVSPEELDFADAWKPDAGDLIEGVVAEITTRDGEYGSYPIVTLELVFGLTPTTPFTPNRVQGRADDAWRDAGLERLTPHEGRHTFASLMIAAGVNAKALATFMGHAKIGITLDRYGHLMPGSEDEAAGLLDAYVEAQRRQEEERARAANGVHDSCLAGELTGEQVANGN